MILAALLLIFAPPIIIQIDDVVLQSFSIFVSMLLYGYLTAKNEGKKEHS